MKIRPTIIWSVIFAPFLIVSLASCVDGGGNSNSGYGGTGGTIRNGWRVASIEWQYGGGDWETVDFFYEDGRLVQEIRTEYYTRSYDGTVDQTTTESAYEYDGAGRLIQKTYTENRIESGPDGEQESSSSYLENYFYDSNGNLVRREEIKDSAPQENHPVRKYYYENGLLVLVENEKQDGSDSSAGWFGYSGYFGGEPPRVKYYYDEKRRMIRIEDNTETWFYYDDSGKLVKKVERDNDSHSNDTYTSIFRYDEKGRVERVEYETEFIERDSVDQSSSTFRLRYDGNGNPIKVEWYDVASGAVVTLATIKWERGPCRRGWFDANTLTPDEKASGFYYKCY